MGEEYNDTMEKNTNNHGKRKKRIIIGTISALIVLVVIIVYGYHSVKQKVNTDTIYSGISIDGIDMGGKTREEAVDLLESKIQNSHEKKEIVLYYGDQNWVIPYKQWGFATDYRSVVDRAYQIGRTGTLWQRYNLIKDLEKNNREFTLNFEYDGSKINEVIAEIKNHFSNEPKNAIIQRINGKFVIQEEAVGLEVDEPKSKEAIKSMLDSQKSGKVEIQVIENKPEITTETLGKIKDKLGGYTTKYNANGNGRDKNLQVAASKLNGTVILPNRILSVNETIGPTTKENGYYQAPVIVSGKLVPGYGGGVCQIATTTYNAALLSELEVVERSNHSLPVGYIDLSRDATVAGTTIDLKFKNNTEYPIYVESMADKGDLTVNVYGYETRNAARTIDFEPVVIEKIPPPPGKMIEDPSLPKGTRVTNQSGKYGYKAKLYKLIYENGELVNKEAVNYSYYRPVAGEVRVGTKVTVSQEPINDSGEMTEVLNPNPANQPEQSERGTEDESRESRN